MLLLKGVPLCERFHIALVELFIYIFSAQLQHINSGGPLFLPNENCVGELQVIRMSIKTHNECYRKRRQQAVQQVRRRLPARTRCC